MLDFKNGLQFLGILLILVTCVICLNYKCNLSSPKIITDTKIKTDTVVKYVYGGGQGKKIIHKVIRVRDTVTMVDTAIIYRDNNLNLIVENANSDTPLVSYRILEKNIRDSIFIESKSDYKNSFNAGMITSFNSFSPVVSYSTYNCNYLVGYDVINKAPSFGFMLNLSNIARPKRTGQR